MDTMILIELSVGILLAFIVVYNIWIMFAHKEIAKINTKDFTKNLVPHMSSDRKTEKLFDRAKNPWNMSIQKFKQIRFIGLAIGIPVLAVGYILLGIPYGILPGILVIGFAWVYPSYFYKATGDERELEWNKMYAFIWKLKNDLKLYDPKQAFINIRVYLELNFPEDKELIQGFKDFADHWREDEIDEYLKKYYPFSVPKEIIQIAFNSQQTGTSPVNQLDQLRQFTKNQQDKAVIKILANTTSMATASSLPFMLISIIVALAIPMVMQFMKFL